MSFHERSDERKRFINAAHYGRLKDVMKLSNKFVGNVEALGEALIRSCWKGHLDVVKWLTMEHTAADVNYRSVIYTPLTAACDSGHLEIVKYLLNACRADVNLPDRYGYPPLIRACYSVHMTLSIYFLAEVIDLDVNIKDKEGNTALHYAVWCIKEHYIKLHRACNMGGDVTEVLRLLYACGHNINAQDNDGDTALHLACDNGLYNIVETLILAGADETITNNDGETPAQLAEKRGHSELLKLLDRNMLWDVLQLRKKLKKLWSVCSLVLLTLHLMRIKATNSGNWCYSLILFRVTLAMKSVTISNTKHFKIRAWKKCAML